MIQRDTRNWLTVRAALRQFGLSRATLYRLIAAGKVARARRAGDPEAYVSIRDLKRVTALRVRSPKRYAARVGRPKVL